ncbi:MAG: alpha-ribazole phosphatase [archaeon]|nr:alpha-ribazole phosphatase [archaeon]
MEIFLIRHTKVKEEFGTLYGHTDVGLAETFTDEANSVKNSLKIPKNIIIYSSPLSRCMKLSKEIFDKEPIQDKRIMEQNFGDWELKKWGSIEKTALNKWFKDYVNVPCPNGECYQDLYDRVSEFFDEIIEKKHKSVAIVSHGGVIRAIISHVLKIPLEKVFILQIDFSSISKINYRRRSELDSMFEVKYINRRTYFYKNVNEK